MTTKTEIDKLRDYIGELHVKLHKAVLEKERLKIELRNTKKNSKHGLSVYKSQGYED